MVNKIKTVRYWARKVIPDALPQRTADGKPSVAEKLESAQNQSELQDLLDRLAQEARCANGRSTSGQRRDTSAIEGIQDGSRRRYRLQFLPSCRSTRTAELNAAVWQEIFREEGRAGCGMAAKKARSREKQRRYRARKKSRV